MTVLNLEVKKVRKFGPLVFSYRLARFFIPFSTSEGAVVCARMVQNRLAGSGLKVTFQILSDDVLLGEESILREVSSIFAVTLR